MSKHTPGSWSWLEADTIDETNSVGPWTLTDGNNDLATFYSEDNANGPATTHEQSIANVVLAAAAPDLLRSLTALRERVLAYRHQEEWPQAMRDALDEAQLAIWQATNRGQ